MTITVNKQKIKIFNFSGGECYVTIKNIEIGDVTNIEAYLYNSDDVMRLLMVNAETSSKTLKPITVQRNLPKGCSVLKACAELMCCMTNKPKSRKNKVN